MLKKCAAHMLLPIGGPWAKDEVLFHIAPNGVINDEEQEAVVQLLFE